AIIGSRKRPQVSHGIAAALIAAVSILGGKYASAVVNVSTVTEEWATAYVRIR
ncbi:MAG: hypothetical protein ACI9EF_002745, partial [Pseudohongiellaceae bacterium]